MRRRRRFEFLRLWLAILVAALPLVGEIALTAHHAVQRHVLCASHGELLDVDGSAHVHTARRAHAGDAVAQANRSDPRAVQVDPSESSDAAMHEHCVLASFTRPQCTSGVAHTLGAGAILGSVPTLASPAEVVHASVSTILLAPKHSPPA